MNQESQKNNTVMIVIAVIGVVGTIVASVIGAIGNYNTEKFRQEAELTRIALVTIATQGGATQAFLQNTMNAPTELPVPTYTVMPTNISVPTATTVSVTTPTDPSVSSSPQSYTDVTSPFDTTLDQNYFKVSINGDERVYRGNGFNFFLDKWVADLRRIPEFTDDSFYFWFPPNIKSGDVFLLEGRDFSPDIDDTYEITYTTILGKGFYTSSLEDGDFYVIAIEIWDETNGIAVGNIAGEIHPYFGTPIIFTDGKFVLAINKTIY